MDSLEPQLSAELSEAMDSWAGLLAEVVRLGVAVGESNAPGPVPESPYASEIEELRSHPRMSDGRLEVVTRDALGYLSAAGRHCLAFSKLLETREIFISLLPLLRAQLETYGRIAWFLEPTDPEGQRIAPHRRVARHHMDVLASLCRERYSASRRGDPDSAVKDIKRDRDAIRRETLKLFPEAQLEWTNPGDEVDWSCGEDKYLGLGGGADLFDRVVQGQARGQYDSLSDFTHPSIPTIRRMTRPTERDGYISYDWTVEPADAARQVWNCGAMHAQAAKLVAVWLGAELVDEFDDLADRLTESTRLEQ